MKKILVLSLIFVFSLALGGCVKKATQPTNPIDSNDYEQNTGENPAEKPNTEVNPDSTKIDPGVTKEDLDKLKSDINALEFEDLTGLSE